MEDQQKKEAIAAALKWARGIGIPRRPMSMFIAGRPMKTWSRAHDTCQEVYRLLVSKQAKDPGDPVTHPQPDRPGQSLGRPARSQQSPGSSGGVGPTVLQRASERSLRGVHEDLFDAYVAVAKKER